MTNGQKAQKATLNGLEIPNYSPRVHSVKGDFRLLSLRAKICILMHACMFVQYNMPTLSSYLLRCLATTENKSKCCCGPSVHHVSIHLDIIHRCILALGRAHITSNLMRFPRSVCACKYDAREPRFLVLDERRRFSSAQSVQIEQRKMTTLRGREVLS